MSIVSGLIAGALTLGITTYASNRLRGQDKDGSLRWGWGLMLLGFLSLTLATLAGGAYFYDNDVWTDTSEFVAITALLIGFGFSAVYCFMEYFVTRGTYTDKGIEIRTPWTGQKSGCWRDLEYVEYNGWMSWYVLTFADGSVIRVSEYLSGHHGVLETLEKMA